MLCGCLQPWRGPLSLLSAPLKGHLWKGDNSRLRIEWRKGGNEHPWLGPQPELLALALEGTCWDRGVLPGVVNWGRLSVFLVMNEV